MGTTMMYAYYLYSGKSFCRLDIGFTTPRQAFDEAVEVMQAAKGYYSHGEIATNRRVVGKINKDLKYEATVLELDGSEVGPAKDALESDRKAP